VWWSAKASGADPRFVDIGLVFTAAGCYALIASHDPKRPMTTYFAFGVIAILILLNIMKGSRSSVVTIGIAAGWCTSQRVRRIGLMPVLAATFVMFVAIPILGEWRDTRRIEATRQVPARDLVADAIYGMGATIQVFGYSLDYIPRTKPYAMGISYWQALLQTVPNLSLTPGALSLGVTTVETHPDNWLTSTVSPFWFESGGGYGYAMGAEFYFNFGFTGVILGSALFGFLLVRVRNASDRSALILAVSALLFAHMAGHTRDVFGSPFKAFAWSSIALLILRGVTSMFTGVASGPKSASDGTISRN
jgi:oligosaccharide repeat unit polymerase